jgi:hypothetical protein
MQPSSSRSFLASILGASLLLSSLISQEAFAGRRRESTRAAALAARDAGKIARVARPDETPSPAQSNRSFLRLPVNPRAALYVATGLALIGLGTSNTYTAEQIRRICAAYHGRLWGDNLCCYIEPGSEFADEFTCVKIFKESP